ncbi:hypothetical protein ACV333_32940, partial [Pseudomonas aeruginosa]
LKARHYAGRSALGIQVQAPSIAIARTVEWKDAIVDRHAFAVEDPRPALDDIDPVFLQQRGDAAGEAVDDGV